MSDRLSFLECILLDEVKGAYKSSQDSLTKAQLDSRYSIMKLADFYDKVSEVFNRDSFCPTTMSLPDLYKPPHRSSHH